VIGLSNLCKCVDHCGRLFSSVKEMCTFHNVLACTYRFRLKSGFTLEQALSDNYLGSDDLNARLDHSSKSFKSVKEMCSHYGISVGGYYARLRQGYTKEQALTKELRGDLVKCVDHNGMEFSSADAMCKHHNVQPQTYGSRIRRGYTLEQALTGKGIRKTISVTCKDHKDNEFPSVKAMCDYYGIDESNYYVRLKRGYTLEQALTGKGTKRDTRYKHYDHKGKGFTSLKEMCEYHGVTINNYKNKRKRGCTLEQALSCDDELAKRTDHNGRVFDTIDAMCKHYNIVRATYYLRLQKGYTKEQALTGKKPNKNN